MDEVLLFLWEQPRNEAVHSGRSGAEWTMKTTNYKRPNRGAQLLTRVADSGREVASHLGVSPSTAGYWRTGERKPNPTDRDRLSERYGIPVEAWDELPATRGRKKKAAEAPAVPVTASEPATTTTAPATEADIDATLQSNAARLNRMILSDLARLEGEDGAALELGKRAEVLKKLSDAQVSLAKATGETVLTMQRIAAHPEFQRCARMIVDAIAPYPDALAAVTKVFESERSK